MVADCRKLFGYGGGEGSDVAFGVVGGAYEGAALDVLDAFGLADHLVPAKDVRVNELLDRQVHPRGLQVLADRHDIDAVGDEIIHQLDYFILGLAQAYHDAALRTQSLLLGAAKHLERALVVGLRAHAPVESRYGFDVVIEDVRPRIEHDLECVPDAAEIRDKHLDGATRLNFADPSDGFGKDGRAAILTLVSVHAGDDGMPKAHVEDGIGHAVGLVPIEPRSRAPGLDRAKPA